MSMTEDTVEKVEAKFGGTWQKLENRFLLGASSTYPINTTGGSSSASYTPVGTVGDHTLTVDEMPSHSHSLQLGFRSNTGDGTWWYRIGSSAGSWTDADIRMGSTGGSQPHSHPFTGTQTDINTMPPYITVYMYKRVS